MTYFALSDAPVGVTLTIRSVDCPQDVALRLGELGFLPSAKITVVARAPLGDPLWLVKDKDNFCLRRSSCEGISVSL